MPHYGVFVGEQLQDAQWRAAVEEALAEATDLRGVVQAVELRELARGGGQVGMAS